MRNWSSEFNKKIRKWLDIDTYRKFDSLTLQELYYEIWVRTLFFKENPDEEETRLLGMFYGNIVSGKPFLVTPQMVKNMNPDVRLYQPPHFFFTTTERLAQISVTAMLNEMYYWIGDNTYRINLAHSGKVITEVLEDKFPTSILLEVDLANGTDEEITESIKAALPQWRRFKGIPESPPDPVRFGHGTIKKLINYRIIPMLDIIIWAAKNNLRMADDRLSRLLYTDDDDDNRIRHAHHIKDTDRPLAMKAVKVDFLRQFNLYINKNNEMKNWRVSDVMKLSETEAD
ncbi:MULTISPECIES: DUF6387 family protein [Pantoea]|uniref:DUF6387 family protein n=1 Tax=Pantoea TaxID=53335 RepID=UPI000735EB72|nr:MULTISPECIES: DUF6387 family protein [Pantoea]KAA6101385.1 hypothetical protein F3I21_07175 [Pantoea sp. B_9]KAA6109644.1 hypothetical protein F3I18_18945 [Pantoea sp. B_10]KTS28530.1 hypothetical protein NS381_08500 [Pantoea stewartii]